MTDTDKSTVSRTITYNLVDKRDLDVSFFFKRGEGDRDHVGLFIVTIATQLVQNIPSLVPHVQNVIKTDSAISKKTLNQQFETLVLQPLDKIRTGLQKYSRIVIIINVLDEYNRKENIKIIIRLLLQVQHISSIQLKFFLINRPEFFIRFDFKDISNKYKRLILH